MDMRSRSSSMESVMGTLATGTGIAPFCLFLWNILYGKVGQLLFYLTVPVTYRSVGSNGRLQGHIEVSRAFGDCQCYLLPITLSEFHFSPVVYNECHEGLLSLNPIFKLLENFTEVDMMKMI
ncbi:hypothetical protein ACJX0J_021100, partial [Zea mays]